MCLGIPGSVHTPSHSLLYAALGVAPDPATQGGSDQVGVAVGGAHGMQTCFPIGSGLVTVVLKKPSHSSRPYSPAQ